MKIKDIGRVVTGKTPTTENFRYFDGNYMFITPADIAKGFVLTSSERTLTEEGYLSISSNTLHGTSVLVGCIGSDMGNVAIVEKDCATNQQINAITDITCHINPYYVYYYLSMRKSYLRKLAGVTTTPILPKSTFEEIDIVLPLKTVQDKVVNILYTLDDKIYHNTLICAELEDMAKTLYDYWFTQFDFPNEEGKPYRSSGGAMEWNEQLKREIPKGWKVDSLSHAISSINTGLNPRDNFVLGNGDIQYLTVKNLTTSGTIDFGGCDTVDEQARKIIHKRSDISVGDVLFASIAPLGRCYLIQSTPEKWDINESVFSIRPNTTNVTSEFLYMFFMSDAFIKGATSSSTGSIFKGIRINTLLDIVAVIPPKDVIDAFTAEIKTMLELKEQTNNESGELVKLRDWLLPMLMNGQATVK